MKALQAAVLAGLLATPAGIEAQTVLERSPNIQGVWGLDTGDLAFVLAHRFEVLSGGDELVSIPTLTLAGGLPLGFTTGVDFTSYSEVVPGKETGNEAQFWLKRPLELGGLMQAAALAGYNTAAESFDAALDLTVETPLFDIFGEARTHSSMFGSGDFGASGTLGVAISVNRYVALTGDYGRVLTEAGTPGVWSAALAVAIPASPHSLSLQLSNGGATTLHGVSREKTLGTRDVRYGFSFTVPLGNRSRWTRLFRPAPPEAPVSVEVRTVTVADNSFHPAEISVRVGESVEWVNNNPIVHTISAVDGSWSSDRLEEGERYRRIFTEPGRYAYYCGPHRKMRGTVVVSR